MSDKFTVAHNGWHYAGCEYTRMENGMGIFIPTEDMNPGKGVWLDKERLEVFQQKLAELNERRTLEEVFRDMREYTCVGSQLDRLIIEAHAILLDTQKSEKSEPHDHDE